MDANETGGGPGNAMTPDAPLSEPVIWAVFEAREVGARTILNAQAPGVEMVEAVHYYALVSRVTQLEQEGEEARAASVGLAMKLADAQARCAGMEKELIEAGVSYDRGYKQGIEDGHRCEQRHAHIDQLEQQHATLTARCQTWEKFAKHFDKLELRVGDIDPDTDTYPVYGRCGNTDCGSLVEFYGKDLAEEFVAAIKQALATGAETGEK